MELPSRLLSAAHAVAGLGADFAGMSDQELVAGFRAVSELDRVRGIFAAGLAGQLSARSSRQFGYAGLAQRQGFLSPEALIQSITGAPRAEAAKHVAVGEALDTPIGAAVLDGRISVDAAAAIQRGLGISGGAASSGALGTEDAATEADLAAATETLIAEAQTTNVDRLFRRARDARDELDADSVERREKSQRDLRYLHYSRRGDGMVRGSFLLDPLDGGLVLSALDAVLSPKRGGPRMVDAEQKAMDAILSADGRSTDQIAADALVAMVRLAVDADPGTLFGRRRPAVRVVVGERALATRTGAGKGGAGQLEDGAEPVSIETIERLICDAGVLGIQFDDDGQCVNVGRTQRLFTERQRVALAVRDGGCRFPLCDRPPSWAEAHHIEHWHRDGGKTDLADGILLCRRHHLLVHNNSWEISRDKADYWLTPPPDIDATQKPIPMPTKARPFEMDAAREKRAG